MKILFQGDSITDTLRNRDNPDALNGLGSGYVVLTASYMQARYPDKGLEFINRGIIGNRITDILARWKKDCLNVEPDILFIYDGINDIWHDFVRNNGVSAKLFESVYRLMLDQAFERNPNLRVILIEPYFYHFGKALEANPDENEWKIRIGELCSAIERIASDYDGITDVIHTQKLFDEALERAPRNHWSKDGVHLSPAGNQLLADECIRILKKHLNLA